MAPDLPVRIRELALDERGATLGSQLADGYVVVTKGLADAARYGDERMTRQRRRAEARAQRKRAGWLVTFEGEA